MLTAHHETKKTDCVSCNPGDLGADVCSSVVRWWPPTDCESVFGKREGGDEVTDTTSSGSSPPRQSQRLNSDNDTTNQSSFLVTLLYQSVKFFGHPSVKSTNQTSFLVTLLCVTVVRDRTPQEISDRWSLFLILIYGIHLSRTAVEKKIVLVRGKECRGKGSKRDEKEQKKFTFFHRTCGNVVTWQHNRVLRSEPRLSKMNPDYQHRCLNWDVVIVVEGMNLRK